MTSSTLFQKTNWYLLSHRLTSVMWILFAILLPTSHGMGSGEVFNVTIEPRSEEAFGKAHYRLWIPPRVKVLQGILVRQHGCGPGARKLGLEHADDIQWQALALKWNCALLGTQLWAPEEDCSTWTMPEDGSARAFHSALDLLSKQSQHAELTRIPWALWGHSGGAVWVMNMTYLYPERVLATFPRSGGLSPVGRKYTRSLPQKENSNPKAFAVPILFCFGEKEDVPESRFNKGIQGARLAFETGRKQGAIWSLAVHPNADHENKNSRHLAIRFFDKMLEARLPEVKDILAEGNPVISPKPISASEGWYGNLKTFKYIKGNSTQVREVRTATNYAWFPDSFLAYDWNRFCKEGSIRDITAPPSPTNLKATQQDSSIQLRWDAVADIESGIAAFEIRRNGRTIGIVKGKVNPRWNPKGFYHSWNYSDQPLDGTLLPEKTYLDQDLSNSKGKVKYEVLTINQAGLRSLQSASIEVMTDK